MVIVEPDEGRLASGAWAVGVCRPLTHFGSHPADGEQGRTSGRSAGARDCRRHRSHWTCAPPDKPFVGADGLCSGRSGARRRGDADQRHLSRKSAGVEHVAVRTAEKWRAVLSRRTETDVLVMAAAVADYRPATQAEHKIKKSDTCWSTRRTQDVLNYRRVTHGWLARTGRRFAARRTAPAGNASES